MKQVENKMTRVSKKKFWARVAATATDLNSPEILMVDDERTIHIVYHYHSAETAMIEIHRAHVKFFIAGIKNKNPASS